LSTSAEARTASEKSPGGETVLKKTGEQRRILAQRHQAIADVARRQHIEVAAQAAGAATIVGDGDDGGDFEAGNRRVAGLGEILQPLQQRRKSRSTTDRNHPEWRSVSHAESVPQARSTSLSFRGKSGRRTAAD
jgi:hypothetical protein